MLKTYCQHCGGANEYASEKPKFCAKCGKSFSLVKATAKPPAFSYSLVDDKDSLETETETETENPFKVEADIIVERHKGTKLGDIGLQQKTGFERGSSRQINISVKNKNLKEYFDINLPELPDDDG